MSATADQELAELRRAYEKLQNEHTTALAELQARSTTPAQHKGEHADASEQRAAAVEGETLKAENEELRAAQAAGLEVLQAMIASPGNTQPVFDLIARQAAKLCDVPHGVVANFDGELIHLVTHTGMDPAAAEVLVRQFPRPPGQDIAMGRAILSRQIEQIEDITADLHRPFVPPPGQGSVLAVPLLRDGTPLGVIAIGRQARGPFSRNQITLLQTFAEQAVIAITSAETYRELQDRTAALAQRNSEYGERIEQQAATIDVLKVMSASPDDALPVFRLVVERARAFCEADGASLAILKDDMLHLQAYAGDFFPNYEADFPRQVSSATMFGRAVLACDVVQMPDVSVDPAHYTRERTEQVQRAIIAVPLLRAGAPIGAVAIGRRRSGEFSTAEVELLRTFAEQAVIAISSAETYRALHDALEQQTATAEVLQVINASPGDLAPVFDTMLEKALLLCEASFGGLQTFDGELFRMVANRGNQRFHDLAMSMGAFRPAPGTTTHRLVRGESVVQVLDLSAEEGGGPTRQTLVEIGGARTFLSIALRKDETLVGALHIYRQEVRLFGEREIALLQNFAAQAVIAMENVRLITEQREALEQQTATAEVLQVINASPGNLAPVFDAMLDKALGLCDAAFGILWTHDGERGHAVAFRGVPPAFAEYLTRAPHPIEPGGVHNRLLDGESIVHIADAGKDHAYRFGNRLRGALVELGGARTVLAVPLRKDSAYLGHFVIYRREVRPFFTKQIAFLQNSAAQAVIAMENARLLNEQREALEQQTATAQVMRVINTSLGDLTPVFDTILENARRICTIDIGSLALYDGEFFRAVATHGYEGEAEVMARTPYRPLAFQRELLRGVRLIHIPDLEAHTFEPDETTIPAFAKMAGFRACLMIPLRRDGALLGFLTGYRKVAGPFSDKQVALLENFAAQAVIAIENARLLTETREALEQQTATAEVLRVINASPGQLQLVFNALLEKAMRLCGAAFGSLYTYDGTRFHSGAQLGVPHAYSAVREKTPPSGQSGGPATRILQTKRTVHIVDMASEEAYQSGNEGIRALVELGGARTILGVPLLKDGTVLGYISIYRQEVRGFSSKEIALLESFASQAVIAMENARLLTEQREALEQQTATAEVLQVINESPGELALVFDAMLEKAMRLCDAACGGLFTSDGERFHTVATRGVPAAMARFRERNPPTARLDNVKRLLETRRPVQVLDLKLEAAYRSGDIDARAIVDLGGARTNILVPLLKDQILVGFFGIYRQEERAFSEKQISLLENFAAQAVIAMENARLLNELRARTDELAQRQAELRVTFENMGDGVAMFDETQHLVAWNGQFQEVFNLPDALLEQHRTYEEYLRFLAERGDFGVDFDTAEQIHELVATTGQPYGYERTRPDGRVIEVRRNPVPDGGFVLMFSDITERKRSEAEIWAARDAAEAAYRDLKAAQASLIQAEKMASLGQLTAGIAHEIKNPLNFVNNFAELSGDMLDELNEAVANNRQAEVNELTETLKGNLAKIAEHGRRADGIVRGMLEHSRGSSGERRLVELNALVDEALNLAYHGARAQDQTFNVTLRRKFGEGIAPITLAPQDVTRVLLNLISNGFYAARERQRTERVPGFEPTLKVSTREVDGAVEIRVRDNGIGVPPEIRDRLFQPFFTTKPPGEGTGLGLSMSYDIITQQHGGSISVDSKVGEYSEFTVRLPRNS